jgi:hypothetical protein
VPAQQRPRQGWRYPTPCRNQQTDMSSSFHRWEDGTNLLKDGIYGQGVPSRYLLGIYVWNPQSQGQWLSSMKVPACCVRGWNV